MPAIKVDQIFEYIQKNPGLTAKQIADKFGVARREVNSILYAYKGKRFQKDDNSHSWYLAGTKIALSPENNLKSSPHRVEKRVVTELTSFPGHSLFSIQYGGENIKISLNKKHDFFLKTSLLNDDHKSNELVLLLEALANALEQHYTEIDFIEEVINDWGYFLNRKIDHASGC